MLFGQLNPDIFALFAGSNRFLYERVLIGLYEGFYRSDLHFPSQAEVLRRIYDDLGNNVELWREDEAVAGDEFLAHLEQLLARVDDTESEPEAANDDGDAQEEDEA